MAQTPKYSLQEIFAIIDSGDKSLIWISAPSRSVIEIVKVYQSSSQGMDAELATKFIIKGLRALTPDCFVERVLQWDAVADVYGIIFDGKPWYVKFMLEDGIINEISFHPPEKPLKTISDRVIG